jgi:hypothetical protein
MPLHRICWKDGQKLLVPPPPTSIPSRPRCSNRCSSPNPSHQ